MESLYRSFRARLQLTGLKFIRYLYSEIHWDDRLIGIVGARGVGKTTLMLQYIKQKYGNSNEVLYVSLDDLYFSNHSFFDLAENFWLNGGRVLFVDEVHKYINWPVELKNIYDVYTGLQVIFSGSSAIGIHLQGADLSRRAAVYKLNTLSIREFIAMESGQQFDVLRMETLLIDHVKIASEICSIIKPVQVFNRFLVSGSYPFFLEAKAQHLERLRGTINTVIENDLFAIENFTWQTVSKLRKLLILIAESVPFKPNISELSIKTGISRDFLMHLLDLLDKSSLIRQIRQVGSPASILNKPEKIYLANPVLMFALSANRQPEKGTLRETFFAEQVGNRYSLQVPVNGDFLVDGKYTVEIGGKNKTSKQIAGINDAYIAKDDIEFGLNNSIPLWLFGFLY